MKKIVSTMILLVTCLAFSQPVEIILIRHAEKPVDPTDNHLSPQGLERAKALPVLFTHNTEFTTNGRPAALFAAKPEKNGSRRAVETLKPTAKKLHKTLQTPFISQDVHKLLHEEGLSHVTEQSEEGSEQPEAGDKPAQAREQEACPPP